MAVLGRLFWKSQDGGSILDFMVRGKGGEGEEISHFLLLMTLLSFARLLKSKSLPCVGYLCGLNSYRG